MAKRKPLTLTQQIDRAVDRLMTLYEDPDSYPADVRLAEAAAAALIERRNALEDDFS
jgi:hypothetical protein